MGHFREIVDGVEVRRGETFTCAHCNRAIECRDNQGMFKPPTMCTQEHKPLCKPCAREADARPPGPCAAWERKMAKIEARDRLLRQIGVID